MIKIKDKADFLVKLDEAIQGVRDAIAQGKAGKAMPGEPEQYRRLLKYLEDARRNATSGKLPARTTRMSKSLSWMLVDGWDPADRLGDLIGCVDHFYVHRL